MYDICPSVLPPSSYGTTDFFYRVRFVTFSLMVAAEKESDISIRAELSKQDRRCIHAIKTSSRHHASRDCQQPDSRPSHPPPSRWHTPWLPNLDIPSFLLFHEYFYQACIQLSIPPPRSVWRWGRKSKVDKKKWEIFWSFTTFGSSKRWSLNTTILFNTI